MPAVAPNTSAYRQPTAAELAWEKEKARRAKLDAERRRSPGYGTVQGDKKSVGQVAEDAYDASVDAFVGAPPNLDPLEEDRKRAAAIYASREAERAGYTVPVQNINAATVAGTTLDTARGDAIGDEQRQYIERLKAVESGKDPSAATLGYMSKIQDQQKDQKAFAAQARGSAGVFARQQARDNIGELGRKAAIDAALAETAERAATRNVLGNALTQTREADDAVARERARLAQEANLRTADYAQRTAEANQKAGLEGRQLEQTYKLGLGNQSVDATRVAADVAQTKLKQEELYKEKKAEHNKGLLNTGVDIAGKIFTLSDERTKEDIEPVDHRDVDRLLDNLNVVTFKYKGDPEHRPHAGVLAQELEKDPLGSAFVNRDDEGMRHVDYQGLLTTLIAGLRAEGGHGGG